MINNEQKTADFLDNAIIKLIETALDDVDPASESCAIYALSKIPGLDIKLVGCVDDLGEPETVPEEVYLVADYNGFLRFGCNLVSTEDGWVIDEIFCRETKREAYGMLEFLSGQFLENSDAEEGSDANIDVIIAIAQDEDEDEYQLDDLILVDEEDEDFDPLEVPDDYEETFESMFEEEEEEKNQGSEDDFKPLYRL